MIRSRACCLISVATALVLAWLALGPAPAAFAADAPQMSWKFERNDDQYTAVVTYANIPLTGSGTIGVFRADAPDTQPIISESLNGGTGTARLVLPARATGAFQIRVFQGGKSTPFTGKFELNDSQYPRPASIAPSQPAAESGGAAAGNGSANGPAATAAQPAQSAGHAAQPAAPPAAQSPGQAAQAAQAAQTGQADAAQQGSQAAAPAPVLTLRGVTLRANNDNRLWLTPGQSMPVLIHGRVGTGPEFRVSNDPLASVTVQLAWATPDGQEVTLDPQSGTFTLAPFGSGPHSVPVDLPLPAEVGQAWLDSGQLSVPGVFRVSGADAQGHAARAELPFVVNIDLPPAQPASPVLAWYYPQFSKGVAGDVTHMQQAGIDTVILSQTGYQVGRPVANAPIIQALRGTNLTYTVGIETNVVYNSQEHLIGELRRLLTDEVQNPRWLRYKGKPVLVFWALNTVPVQPGQSPQDAWASIRQQVDPDRASIWIAEGGDVTPGTGTMTYLPTFDGLHLYSVAWDEQPGRALQGWERRLHSADPSKLWVATVMPGGYYGAGIVGSDQWTYRDRQDGRYLQMAWDGVLATHPAMVILTSWNEQKERTGIYPESADAGPDPALYLDINHQASDRWRAASGAPAYAATSVSATPLGG